MMMAVVTLNHLEVGEAQNEKLLEVYEIPLRQVQGRMSSQRHPQASQLCGDGALGYQILMLLY